VNWANGGNRMFDTDRSGSVSFDEFWYDALVYTYSSLFPSRVLNDSQRPLGLPLRLALSLRSLRRRPQRHHLLC
jgi:hypothetical protein